MSNPIFKHVTTDRYFDVTPVFTRRYLTAFRFHLAVLDSQGQQTLALPLDIPLADVKLDCHDLLYQMFSESLITGGREYERGQFTQTFLIRKDPKYRMPYVIQIYVRSEGAPFGKDHTLTLLLSERDIRKMAQAVLDYTRRWESVEVGGTG